MVSYFVTEERSHSILESDSIVSIFPPYSSDSESDGSSESNESPPRCSYSMESIETIFPPWRSPNHSDSFESFEEIFPIDHFISTSSTRTPQHK